MKLICKSCRKFALPTLLMPARVWTQSLLASPLKYAVFSQSCPMGMLSPAATPGGRFLTSSSAVNAAQYITVSD